MGSLISLRSLFEVCATTAVPIRTWDHRGANSSGPSRSEPVACKTDGGSGGNDRGPAKKGSKGPTFSVCHTRALSIVVLCQMRTYRQPARFLDEASVWSGAHGWEWLVAASFNSALPEHVQGVLMVPNWEVDARAICGQSRSGLLACKVYLYGTQMGSIKDVFQIHLTSLGRIGRTTRNLPSIHRTRNW